MNFHEMKFFSASFCSIFLALIAILGAKSVNAGCANDSQRKPECSAIECEARYALVHDVCDISKVCAKKSPKEQLEASLEKHKDCKRVRERVADCFIEPDAGHILQITDAENGIKKCERFLRKLESK